MIPFSNRRDQIARRSHETMHNGITRLTAGRMWLAREGTFSEDYHNASDYFFHCEGIDQLVAVQYKVQHSTTFYTWTVQLSCWDMNPHFYAFYHEDKNHLFLIAGHHLKEMPRNLYDGYNSNQPFYYGDLMDIVRHGGWGIDLNDGSIITGDDEDWW